MVPRKLWCGRRLALVAVALMASLSGGCLFVAAGAAVGAGAVGYYALTHRLYRDYPRDLAETTAATRAALADLRFPPATEESKDGTVSMETKAPDGAKVSIELRVIAGRVPADGMTTRVGIHFGMIGDEEASGRILNQIGERLGLPAPQAQAPPQPQGVQQPLRPVAQPTPTPVETPAPPLAR
jgi:hypothetical protein